MQVGQLGPDRAVADDDDLVGPAGLVHDGRTEGVGEEPRLVPRPHGQQQ